MLPENSQVQKCPGCGKYYFLKDAKTLAPGRDPHKELWDKLYDAVNSDESI